MAKYIVCCGSLYSACGKGIAANSIGLLLRLRGHNVTYIKFDPFLNVNSGIMRPSEHGECWCCDDGSETDLDLGSAERILGINVSKNNICTSGTLYKELIQNQEDGKYLGSTLQLSPHATNLIQDRLVELGKNHDIVIVEIGGTVGDNESFAFFEGIRQFKQKLKDDVLVVLISPVLWVNTVKEFKTKPLQNGVKELRQYGLQPDVIFCRVDRELPSKIMDKISDLTNVNREHIFDAPDVSTVYQVPLEFYDRQVDDLFVDLFRLKRSRCNIAKYRDVVEKYVNNNLTPIEIGVFGKYEGDEAYISLKEALIHGGIGNDVKVNIHWIKVEELEKTKDIGPFFEKLHGVIVPGGFDKRGVEGKIKAIQFCREHKIPFLGICLGLQCAAIEFARNVLGMSEANSLEFDKNTKYPVIHYVEGQEGLKKKSGTMRLGAYDCELTKDSLAMQLYKQTLISERHRHRYEVNREFLSDFSNKGFKVSGTNPASKLVEIMELDKEIHPFFIGTQAHPEYKSRLTDPAPLFFGLVQAAKKLLEN